MSKIKRCRLTRIIPHHKPGSVLNIWGHQWTVQPDHTAIAMIHQDFHEAEVAAGRYIVLPDKNSPVVTNELKNFSNNAEDYFGCKNVKTFEKKLSALTDNSLIEFAESRLSVRFPSSMNRQTIISEIMNLTNPEDTDDIGSAEDTADNENFEEESDNIRLNLDKLKRQTEDPPNKKRGPGRPKKD